METKIAENRSPYWDVVKGLGIILVVWGHAGLPSVKIAYIVNYFHMAIFFYAAGALYKDAHSNDPVLYAGKKLKSIWLPAIKYVIVYIALHNLFLKLNIYSSVTDQVMIVPKQAYSLYEIINQMSSALFTSTYYVELAGAIWFVYPLIIAMVLFCIIHFVLNKLPYACRKFLLVVAVAVLGLAGFAFTALGWKFAWRVDIALISLPIILAGYLLKDNNHLLKWYGFIICLIILCCCYDRALEISYASGIISNYWLFYPATFAGIYAVLYVAKLINETSIAKAIALCGKHSFHIMALHFLAFKVINYIDVLINHKEKFMIAQFPTSNLQWPYYYLIVGIGIPLVLVTVYDKLNAYIKQKINI